MGWDYTLNRMNNRKTHIYNAGFVNKAAAYTLSENHMSLTLFKNIYVNKMYQVTILNKVDETL